MSSSINPYSDPNADDDLFDDGPDGNAVGNSQTAKNFSIRGPQGEHLPAELEEALAQYLGIVISGRQARSNQKLEFRAMSEMLEYFSEMYALKHEETVSMATAELIDEITEGRLTQYHRYHEARRKIISCHIVKKAGSKMLAVMDPDSDRQHMDEVHAILTVYMDLLDFCLARAVQQYKTMSEVLEKELDQQLIEGGLITKRSRWEYYAMGCPPAEEDQDGWI